MVTKFPKCKRSTLKGWTRPGSFIKCNDCFTLTAVVNFWGANSRGPPALLFPSDCWGTLWNSSCPLQPGRRKMQFPQGKGWNWAEQAPPAAVPGAGKQRNARAAGCLGREEDGVCHLFPRNGERRNMNSCDGFGAPWQHFRHTSLALVFVWITIGILM